MVRYLKWIVIVFGSIGLMTLSFFYLQNKTDISAALDYRSKFDYDYLAKNCSGQAQSYIFPCLKKEFESYLEHVSLTGTSMGLKMVFTVMDQDKLMTNVFSSPEIRDLNFSINYLEINNLAMGNVYKRYFGFAGLYGGFVSSLERYYAKAESFSEHLILGLEGVKGVRQLAESAEKSELEHRLKAVKDEYFRTKEAAHNYMEVEMARLQAEAQ
ncbi:MAG: hypothetical protein HON90_07805 [Halobacteriovoraceae bacterium]|jgi:hypothetical protein|nr:hypothetical protein [Halobacteriovoraceae bacterium]